MVNWPMNAPLNFNSVSARFVNTSSDLVSDALIVCSGVECIEALVVVVVVLVLARLLCARWAHRLMCILMFTSI